VRVRRLYDWKDEISREHGISQTLYYRWWDRFLAGGKKGLANGHRDDQAHQTEIEKLKIIGKQAIQIEILKKPRSCSGQSDGGTGGE
jgi:transposase-like protein